MTHGQQIKVSETLWYGKIPGSPDIPATQGLAFIPVDAASESGPTVVLAAAYRVGKPHTAYYGGQFPRPIRVVAVNEQTGVVYEADLNSPEHPPIMVLASDEAAAKPDGSSETAFFNLDMIALLRLPEESGRYKVFLWLDQLVSPVITVDIPANPSRGKGKPVASAPVNVVKFDTEPQTRQPEAASAGLNLTGKPGEPIVHGSGSEIHVEHPDQPVLWIMATSHRDRRFGWVMLRASELPAGASRFSFSLNYLDLVRSANIPQKIFCLGLTTTGVSNVYVGHSF